MEGMNAAPSPIPDPVSVPIAPGLETSEIQTPEIEAAQVEKNIPQDSIADKIRRAAKVGVFAAASLFPSEQQADVSPDSDIFNEKIVHDIKPRMVTENHDMPSYESYLARGGGKESIDDMQEQYDFSTSMTNDLKQEILVAKLGIRQYATMDDDMRQQKIKFLEKVEKSWASLAVESKAYLADPHGEGYKQLLEKYQRTYKILDGEHGWMQGVINSPKYKERLIKEFGVEEAEKMLQKRLANLTDKPYNIVEGYTVSSDARAHYIGADNQVEFPSDLHERGLGVHEFGHDITDGINLMSDHAKEVYEKSFIPDNLSEAEKIADDQYMNTYGIHYFAKPQERDARKKVLEYDLDRLGIKKYGEKFTKEHYQQLLELQKNDMLLEDSDVFLRTTDPKYFEEIMNDIANNQEKPKSDSIDSSPSA